MRLARSWLAIVAALTACSSQPRLDPAREDIAVVLPEAGGKVGTIVVHTPSEEQTLHGAYAAVRIRDGGKLEALTLDSSQVERTFAPALTALPRRPAAFVLYFLEGSDELTPDSAQNLSRVVTEIADRPAAEVSVIGHTDLVGNDQYNDALSTQRANRVRDALLRAGIAADRIDVAARGKREPLYPTAEGVAEPRNRRVEVSVR